MVEGKLAKFVSGAKDELQYWKNSRLQNWNRIINRGLASDEEESEEENPFKDMIEDMQIDKLLGFDGADQTVKMTLAKKILTEVAGVDGNLLEDTLSSLSLGATPKTVKGPTSDSKTTDKRKASRNILTPTKSVSYGFSLIYNSNFRCAKNKASR